MNTKQTFWNDNTAEQTFNKLISVCSRKPKPHKEPKHDFHKPKELKIEIQKRTNNTWTLALNILLGVTFSSLATNALLRGEQRNTKAAA
ncbi:TPA: hypothetical protein ACGSUT_004735 [Vibrio parahaemolyticus]|nr:hypothetical protein [Vibrio parahaemolyticus]HBN6185434.1 hypothetical protein [Vibrio parahaemolyticus]HCD5127200.1 hypothetical protein [Vibrio parahaemolyticus]HCD5137195.1 hypothetical protein [Vibrio parahaemolyticus]HCG8466390.1 hypothetical protein [Vibrio parahaemolyticus]